MGSEATLKRRRAKADGGLTSAVLAYLRTQPDVWAERRNSGGRGIHAKGGAFVPVALSEPGTPDITGYLRAPFTGWRAIPFGIETKSKTGKLRGSQIVWHARAKAWGVSVCVARSVGEVKAFIEGLRRGEF